MAEGIRRLRAGQVIREPGYDGEYGKIRLFTEEELENTEGQLCFSFAAPENGGISREKTGKPGGEQNPRENSDRKLRPGSALRGDAESRNSSGRSAPKAGYAAVTAGPGTGKTKTLVSRILYLLQEKQVKPREITP